MHTILNKWKTKNKELLIIINDGPNISTQRPEAFINKKTKLNQTEYIRKMKKKQRGKTRILTMSDFTKCLSIQIDRYVNSQ